MGGHRGGWELDVPTPPPSLLGFGEPSPPSTGLIRENEGFEDIFKRSLLPSLGESVGEDFVLQSSLGEPGRRIPRSKTHTSVQVSPTTGRLQFLTSCLSTRSLQQLGVELLLPRVGSSSGFHDSELACWAATVPSIWEAAVGPVDLSFLMELRKVADFQFV